ncbi:MAG: hypothetical protein ACK5WY_08020 [Holosporaceae bacterium]
MYKLIKNMNSGEIVSIQRLSDNAFIPLDVCNADYQEYLLWVAAGNTPEAADLPPPPPPIFPTLHRGEFENGLLNLGILTYANLRQSYREADLPYPLKQIVDAAVAGGTPTPEQLQDAPYNLPAPIATGVAMAIAGGLTLTAAEQEKIAYTWVTMVQVGRDYPIIGQLQLVLGIPDAVMDQLFLTRGESING